MVECFSKSEVLFPGFKRKPGLHVCDDVVIVFFEVVLHVVKEIKKVFVNLFCNIISFRFL